MTISLKTINIFGWHKPMDGCYDLSQIQWEKSRGVKACVQ